jgi:hypothetical protein
MSEDVLQKVIDTTDLGSDNRKSAYLPPQQSAQFIDYMWDATVLGSQVRTERLRANEADLDRIHVGERLIRKGVEATDTGENAGVTFSKISLRTEKIRLDWELSTELLEDNLEGEDLEDHIARMMATQLGNDLEDLAINGDTTSTDPTLSIFDGWGKVLVGDGTAAGNMGTGKAHVVDAGGDPFDRAVVNEAIKALPRKYKQRRGDLRLYIGSNFLQDYLYGLTQSDASLIALENAAVNIAVNGPVSAEGPAGYLSMRMFGITVQEVPSFVTDRDVDAAAGTRTGGDAWLTFPKNLVWGVKREVKVYRQFVQKKDAIEYTVFTRVGTAVENGEAAVVIRNLGLEGSTP